MTLTGARVKLPTSGQDATVDGVTELLMTSKSNKDHAVVAFSGVTGGDGATPPSSASLHRGL
ncbi:hypothetical protein QMK28_18260 [Streptomyces sp. H27-D2]|nr:hypothetical protein [Streptomyces sp. H27-D2]